MKHKDSQNFSQGTKTYELIFKARGKKRKVLIREKKGCKPSNVRLPAVRKMLVRK
jgi:hypothetical protein